MLGNFGVFSFLRPWKLARFLTTCLSATSFKIWTFSFFCISLKRLERIFLKSRQIIFIMYITMSETFINIDLLQHLEISRQTYPTNGQKIRATTFTVLFWSYANFSKLMRAIHISVTSTFQCEYCQCFTFKRCDKFKLKCTSHGGMYSAHYFGKISITSKKWML